MHGSILVVQIREAMNLPGMPSCYVEINFQEQIQTTQLRPSTNHPEWNEKFSFDVITGRESLVVNVCSNEFGGRNIIGMCRFGLDNLSPPDYAFDNWLPIINSNSREMGKIKISLQWIISRVEFFNNLLNKIDKEISENQSQLAYNQERLGLLQGKFYFKKIKHLLVAFEVF